MGISLDLDREDKIGNGGSEGTASMIMTTRDMRYRLSRRRGRDKGEKRGVGREEMASWMRALHRKSGWSVQAGKLIPSIHSIQSKYIPSYVSSCFSLTIPVSFYKIQ